jgi:PHD/YefM family antitoxin component YafN of YafNO toxin-antitoxin module
MLLLGALAVVDITVTVHGRPSAVLLSVDDLEALEETIAPCPTAMHSGS